MNKQELVDAVAKRTGLKKGDTALTIEELFNVITDELRDEGVVAIPKFGKFDVAKRDARNGVNPQKPDQKIVIPAKKTPHFKASSILKAIVNDD